MLRADFSRYSAFMKAQETLPQARRARLLGLVLAQYEYMWAANEGISYWFDCSYDSGVSAGASIGANF